jgi:hypothetical protein
MSEELKQAAQQALEALSLALSDVDWRIDSPSQPVIHKAYNQLQRALALRPAAQPASAQAGPADVLGALEKRNIFDAIRCAYDLGYNDARNARAVPGDSAPGYDGKNVEADHGSALFNTINNRLSADHGNHAAPAAQPVGEPIYQHKMADGSWIDQKKQSYDYNVKHGHSAMLRVVYTTPQPVPDRVPMTDEQILQGQNDRGAVSLLSFMKGVRHAEAHHGITTPKADK